MDALILCGGFATRLEPITLFVPKPLLPIGGKPILDHIIENVERQGIGRIVLSTNRKFGDQFEYWIGNWKASGLDGKISLITEPTMHDGEKFGAIKGINYAIERAGFADDLLVIAGDNYFSFDLGRLIGAYRKTGKPTIAVHNIKSVEGATRFGVVEMDGDIVKGFEEKPQHPKSTYISTGIYALPKETLGRFSEYVSDGNNPDAPGYFLQWLIKKEKIYGVVYNEDWHDIGTVDTYREVFEKHLHMGLGSSSDE